MEASVAIVQIPVTWDVEQNLATIAEVLADARPDDIVVLPEGALSGYGTDLSILDRIDCATLGHAMDTLSDLARQKVVHVFCGSLIRENDTWWNAAIYFPPDSARKTYRKINLAMNERGRVAAGSDLSTLPLRLAGGPLTVGVQICREIRFPEQWQYLAAGGAKVFVYLTHAANPAEPPGVWRSHLVSRAAENQRFVLAANVADPRQHCPSMIISPRGEVLAELAPDEIKLFRTTIVIDETADWYLSQRRDDVVELSYLKQSNR